MTNTTPPPTPPPGPLSGLKVLELGQLIAGPFAGKTLADFGAQVIKVEPPGDGDPLRKWRMLHQGTSVWWQVQSRNKQSVVLDLRTDEGRADTSPTHRRDDPHRQAEFLVTKRGHRAQHRRQVLRVQHRTKRRVNPLPRVCVCRDPVSNFRLPRW